MTLGSLLTSAASEKTRSFTLPLRNRMRLTQIYNVQFSQTQEMNFSVWRCEGLLKAALRMIEIQTVCLIVSPQEIAKRLQEEEEQRMMRRSSRGQESEGKA